MSLSFFLAIQEPFGSLCRVARRAKPALRRGFKTVDLRQRAKKALDVTSHCVSERVVVGKELVSFLCAIQIEWVGNEKSHEYYEDNYLQVRHD